MILPGITFWKFAFLITMICLYVHSIDRRRERERERERERKRRMRNHLYLFANNKKDNMPRKCSRPFLISQIFSKKIKNKNRKWQWSVRFTADLICVILATQLAFCIKKWRYCSLERVIFTEIDKWIEGLW